MRYYEFITEASYDQMIMSLRAEYPEQTQMINDNLRWAKANLKKDDRVVWYMKLVKGQLSGNNQMFGSYNFQSFEQLQQDIIHFYGYQSDKIQNYQFKNQTVDQAISDLTRLEQEYQKQQDKEAPVPAQAGDYKLIEFKDGTAWWFVNRAYCEHEGRSGAHCGNAVGKERQDQRILSLRRPGDFKIKSDQESGGHVILTFVLQPNGYLGEMKAKGNKKPDPKWHPHIMSLLLNQITKGIKGAGYLPAMNFSVFDLDDKNLHTIEKLKPKLITTQIQSEPMEFLRAPEWIKNNNKYKTLAVKKLPGLEHILNNDWDSAINQNDDLVIYAPDAMTNRYDKLVDRLREIPELILRANNDIRLNFELLSDVLVKNTKALKYILPNTPRYTELCKLAVKTDPWALFDVPEELKTPELYKIAVQSHGVALRFMPEELKTPEICELAVRTGGWALQSVPKDLKTPELCKLAVQQDGGALAYVPEDLRTPELCKLAVQNNKGGEALYYVPKEYKTLELCTLAVRKSESALKFVPDNLKQQVEDSL